MAEERRKERNTELTNERTKPNIKETKH